MLGTDAAQLCPAAGGQVDEWVDAGPDALIDDLLGGSALPISPASEPYDEDTAWEDLLGGYTANLAHPDAGLHEKMTWFWHTHLTSSLVKSVSMRRRPSRSQSAPAPTRQ